jgi:hygromycin-B 7''-O-kinase
MDGQNGRRPRAAERERTVAIDSEQALGVIAGRHGIGLDQVVPLPGGAANRVYLLGAELVLRIPRGPEFAADLIKEAAVIPRARAAGVLTPALVRFDDSGTDLDLPYLITERAAGTDLGQLDLAEPGLTGVLEQAGSELARLHQLTMAGSGPVPGVLADPGGDPLRLVAGLLDGGWIDHGSARWLADWFGRLAEFQPARVAPVLIHGDAAPSNLLVRSGRLTGLVDWGDAAWADPAMDFAKIPLAGAPAMLRGYRGQVVSGSREPAPPVPASNWEARILWYHLTWALARLSARAPRPGGVLWSGPPASRLLTILQFFATGPPPEWAALT